MAKGIKSNRSKTTNTEGVGSPPTPNPNSHQPDLDPLPVNTDWTGPTSSNPLFNQRQQRQIKLNLKQEKQLLLKKQQEEQQYRMALQLEIKDE